MAITGKLTTIDVGPLGAGMPEIVYYPEATSQTGGAGWPIKINASGNAEFMATNNTAFFGFAVNAGQNVATDGAKQCAIYKISPNRIFEGTLSVASVDQTLIGSHVGWQSSTSTAYLDTANATAKFVLRGIKVPFAGGDNKPRVFFTVMAANIQDVI